VLTKMTYFSITLSVVETEASIMYLLRLLELGM
jgi:hypothetical protein